MKLKSILSNRISALAASSMLGLLPSVASAAALNISAAPAVGSTDPVQADLLVVRPSSTPCTVSLYTGQSFNDFNTKTFQYTPPAACPGPYSKIVFNGDLSVTAGRQFDRTLFVTIGGLNVYFGTTQEPSATIAPSWHFERDITDYAAALAAPQAGAAELGNVVDDTYTGMISGDASLLFYPADANNPAATVPDTVLPLSADAVSLPAPEGSPSPFNSLSLPTNGERVYLDVIAQSQASDEFWWTCAPSDVATELENCGNSAYRETEISIDGKPAGVEPIYPWIYTGGIDPRLWRPTVGVQTLNFVPYRVDLTPFAGVLDDGAAHTIALSVFNVQDHFAVTATLLIFRDAGSTRLSGSVTSNTLTATPVPDVVENLSTAEDGSVSGNVSVDSVRDFSIAGTLKTSHGQVDTTVAQTIHFANVQTYDITSANYQQQIQQGTDISAQTTVVSGGHTTQLLVQRSWPLTLNYAYLGNADGTASQATAVDQAYQLSTTHMADSSAGFASSLLDRVVSSDTLLFDADGNVTNTSNDIGEQDYRYTDSDGSCYDRTVSAQANAVTAVDDVCAASIDSPTQTSSSSSSGGGAMPPLALLGLSATWLLRRHRGQPKAAGRV